MLAKITSKVSCEESKAASPFLNSISDALLIAAFSIEFSILHSSMSIPNNFVAPSCLAKMAKIPVPQPISKTYVFANRILNMVLLTNQVVS